MLVLQGLDPSQATKENPRGIVTLKETEMEIFGNVSRLKITRGGSLVKILALTTKLSFSTSIVNHHEAREAADNRVVSDKTAGTWEVKLDLDRPCQKGVSPSVADAQCC